MGFRVLHSNDGRCVVSGCMVMTLSNQKMNAYLKEIATVAKVNERLLERNKNLKAQNMTTLLQNCSKLGIYSYNRADLWLPRQFMP